MISLNCFNVFDLSQKVLCIAKFKYEYFYGNRGQYIPAMGPNMKGNTCSDCGTGIEKLIVGGGQVYYCPRCQKG